MNSAIIATTIAAMGGATINQQPINNTTTTATQINPVIGGITIIIGITIITIMGALILEMLKHKGE